MKVRETRMRYPMPDYPCDFELPDEWIIEAGMVGFKPTATAYLSTPDAVLVPLHEIEPPHRKHTCPKDYRGFDRARLIDVLKGIVAGSEIKPVLLIKLSAGNSALILPYRFRVSDGFHRFYASMAAGFKSLSATIENEYFTHWSVR